MRSFLANHYRQVSNTTKVTVRKGLRNAIRAKTPEAREFIAICKIMDRNARNMNELCVLWHRNENIDSGKLLQFLRACNFQVIESLSFIEVRA